MKISVKRYGQYFNVDCAEGETPKQALERAVRLKKLGKPYSGPVAAKKDLPKEKAVKKVAEKPIKKPVVKKKAVKKVVKKKATKKKATKIKAKK